jgi:cytochrome c biogenesis protein CcmG/thiol:disulfide interchange protein DsbE
MRPLTFIPLVLFLGLAVLLFAGLQGDPSKLPSVLVGKPAPDFALMAVGAPDGATLVSAPGLSKADLTTGETIVLNVWASWCGPCRVEHPLLMEVARRGDVPLYGLNYKDKPADALRFLAQLGNPYAKSGADITGRVGIDFGVYGVPETFVINGKGEIVLKHVGPIDRAAWIEKIAPAIEASRAD